MSSPETPHPGDPRVRAAQTKRNRTRRALLDAADATFGSRGWSSTRMEDIAATAGVSPATAYNHFPTKHALLGAVFGPLVHPLLVQAEQDIAAGRSMVDALVDQLVALSRVSARHRRLTAAFCCAVHEYTVRVAGPPDPADDADPRNMAPLPEPVRLLVEHGQRTGELRAFPPAVEISGMIVNVVLLRSINRPTEAPGVTAELLQTALFGMLRPDLLAGPDSAERPFRSTG